MNLDFTFKSSDHIRYENGKHVAGPVGGTGAKRAIKVEPNINGGEGYTVTVFNLQGIHPLWQDNVQMAPKQMKIIQQSADKIVLRGFGCDPMGFSFAGYGLTILLNRGSYPCYLLRFCWRFRKGVVESCIMHMYDKGVDIEYLK